MARLDRLSEALAWLAFGTAGIAPFLFGAGERSIWIPLCELWLVLGFAATLARPRRPLDSDFNGLEVSRALLPLHGLFALQLLPMPAEVLRFLSPGSFAAHFLPDPGDDRFRSLSVSPGATVEAWLYVAGLQGLFLAVQGLPSHRRRTCVHAILGVILVLAAEGLWQSRSAHPHWLYGRIPVSVPSGFETTIFGPYFNRNHFATLMALGSGLAAGLAASLARDPGNAARLLGDSVTSSKVIVLAGAAFFLAISAAASGSRSGTVAALVAVAVVAVRSFGSRMLLIVSGLGVASVLLTGSAMLERLANLGLGGSRWSVWVDMTRLFRFFPVFGTGVGAFGPAYWPYQTIFTYEYWRHAHNEYLEWLVEGGILGVVVVAAVGHRLRRSVGFVGGLREAAIGAAIAVATQGLLDYPFRIPANAGILITLIALSTSRPRHPADRLMLS